MNPHCRIGRVKPKLNVILPDINNTLADDLMELSGMARTGEIRSGVVAYITRQGRSGSSWSIGNGNTDNDVLFALDSVRHRFMGS